ncbi:MAG: VOC family protein [Anaerolineae bacterium]|nr:VOC family protein [Anaerolineae bacterium]
MSPHNSVIGGGGFHHVSIRVKDYDACLAFYTEGLGFKVKATWGSSERQTVLLDTGDGNYFEISSGGPDGPRPEGAVAHIALRTDDCDKAIEAARAAGAEITMEPKSVTLGTDPGIQARVAFFRGPGGELVEFFENSQT